MTNRTFFFLFFLEGAYCCFCYCCFCCPHSLFCLDLVRTIYHPVIIFLSVGDLVSIYMHFHGNSVKLITISWNACLINLSQVMFCINALCAGDKNISLQYRKRKWRIYMPSPKVSVFIPLCLLYLIFMNTCRVSS